MNAKHYGAGGPASWAAAFNKHASAWQSKLGAGPLGAYFRRPKYNVPLNIAENDTHYEVFVYALGFRKENIRLTVVDDVLYISGTRTVDESQPVQFIRQEYPIKSFERTVSLHGQIDTTAIRARQEEGVLIITLPKTPEAQQPAQEVPID
jgi:HSP20 family protein